MPAIVPIIHVFDISYMYTCDRMNMCHLYFVFQTSMPLSCWIFHAIDCTTITIYKEDIFHDGVIKWKHFPLYWLFVRGSRRWPVDFHHKGQWRGALMSSLICAWTTLRDAGDLRRHRAHYDVSVMVCLYVCMRLFFNTSFNIFMYFNMTYSQFMYEVIAFYNLNLCSGLLSTPLSYRKEILLEIQKMVTLLDISFFQGTYKNGLKEVFIVF